MIRSLLLIVILVLFGALGLWLYENQGAVQIVWLDYELTTSMWFFVIFVIFLGLVVSIFLWLLGRILFLPRLIVGRYRRHKNNRGLQELESAIIALTSENKIASQKALRAVELLEQNKLTSLGIFLQAESALQAGDIKNAHRYYETLSSDKVFSFLGYRGLSLIAKEQGNIAHAIEFALTAQKLDKNSLWAVRVLASLYEENKEYENAIAVLDKASSQKLWSKVKLAEGKSRLYHLLAMDLLEAGDITGAMKQVKSGYRIDNKNMKLLSLLVILHSKRADYNEAEKSLRPMFESHSADALKTYEEILHFRFPNNSSDAEIQRLSQAEKYLVSYQEQKLVVHFLANLCLRAKIWGKARSYLGTISADEYDVGHCYLMAELEESENGNKANAQAWLERAETKD